MLTKSQLKQCLEEISENAQFTKFNYVSAEKYIVQLKCKVKPDQPHEYYNSYVGQWIKKFSNFTTTGWIVRNCFPKLKRLVFRKVYTCRRSSFNKKKDSRYDGLNQECKARIDFKLKFVNKNTIKNDKFLKEGLNLTVTIDFVHSHKLTTLEAFNLLKSTSDTDEIFYKYLCSGYTPTAAKSYHELSVIDRFGDSPKYLMNSNINPTIRHVMYLHRKAKRNIAENQGYEKIMAARKESLERAGGFLSYDRPEIVIVITPIMTRVISSMSLDHVIVESVAAPNSPITTFLYVPSKAAALPIASILHAEQTKADYSQVFLAVRLFLENIRTGSFEPKLITVQDSSELKVAINAIFPNSTVVLSKWSVCSNTWRWLFGDDCQIEQRKRNALMVEFVRMIQTSTSDDASKYYKKLKDEDSLKDYIEQIWERRDQWLYEHPCSNLVEASIRMMNEFVLRKCKSFNVYVMVDVICKIIENQLRRVLLAHVKKQNLPAAFTRLLVKTESILSCTSEFKHISPKEYRLAVSQSKLKFIKVRLDTWCCNCVYGRKGRFCEHLCAIINIVDTELMKSAELTDEEKCLFSEISGGEAIDDNKIIKPNLEYDIDMKTKESDENGDEDADDNVMDHDDECSISSTKSCNDENYFHVEVKTENDPLEENADVSQIKSIFIDRSKENYYYNTTTPGIETSNTSKDDNKRKYEDSMKQLNDEFRRLNKFFKQNPNRSNLETMVRLTRELSKIRPIEKVNFDNINITLNK